MKSLLDFLVEQKIHTSYNDRLKNAYSRGKDDENYLRNKYHDNKYSKKDKVDVDTELKEIKEFNDKVKEDILFKFCSFLDDKKLILSDNKFATDKPFILYVKADNRFILKGNVWTPFEELKYGNFLLNKNVSYKEIKNYYDNIYEH